MNLGILKLEFKQYLEEQNLIDSTDKKGDANDISIFEYAKEFKDFIESEYKTTDSFSSKSITDIMSMEISSDGKILDTNEIENDKGTQKTNKDITLEKNSDATNNIFKDIYNELIENDEFFNKIDNDGDNKISKDEFLQFMDIIKNFDKENEDISLKDMFSATEYIKENEFDEINNENQKISEVDNAKNNLSGNSENVGSSSSSGTNYSGSSNYAGGSSLASNSNPASESTSEKPINNMSKAELEEEAKTTKSNIADKKKSLNNLYNGKDSQLDEIQDKMDLSFEEYTSELEKENSQMASDVRDVESRIRDKESEISKKEQEITNQETTVSDAENQYNNAIETVDALKATLNKLLCTDSTNFTPEKKQLLSTKIANTTSELGEAEENKKNAEKKVTDEKENLENLKKELNQLKEEDLEALNNEKNTLEATIAEQCSSSIRELMNNYNKSKEEYNVQKNSLIQQASQELISAQDHLNEVNTALNTKNTKETTSKLSMYELFKDDIDYNVEYIDDGETMPYLIIGPKDAEFDEDLPAVLYLHGLGEVGGNANTIMNGAGPANFITDWNLKDFNGYIICPVLTGNYNAGRWQNQKAVGYVDQLLDNITTKYNIDEEKIALTGASLGGTGALYIGKYLSHRFCGVAVMSGYDCGNPEVDPNNFDIPIYGYSGTVALREDETSYNYMNRVFGDKLNVYKCSHSQLPEAVYSDDMDGDGCSDLLELLFGRFNY